MSSLTLILILFYPFLAPVWDKEPFNAENIYAGPNEMFLEDVIIGRQIKYLDQISDPRIRVRIADSLSQCNNPFAAKELEKRLQSEKSDAVNCENLKAMLDLAGVAIPGGKPGFRNFILSDNIYIKSYSSVLHLLSGGEFWDVSDELRKSKTDYYPNFVWGNLASRGMDVDMRSAMKFLDEKISQPNRRGAALYISKRGPERIIRDIRKYLTDKDVTVRAKFAEGMSLRKDPDPETVEILSKDSDATVRGFAASCYPATEEIAETLCRLSKDPDYEVRRLASISLGNTGSDNTVASLLERLVDDCKWVRDVAGQSLVKISPKENFIEEIGTKYLEDQRSCPVAVLILGRLNKRQYSQAVNKVLVTEGADDETVINSIDALDAFDFKESWKDIVKFADNKTPEIRRSVATALGTLNIEESYPVLEKLAFDKVTMVRARALKAMGVTRNPKFSACIARALGQLTMTVSADVRASAAWAAAKTGSNDKKITSLMERITTKRVIAVEGGTDYDSDYSRFSSFWALAELGKKDPDCASIAVKIYENCKNSRPEELSGNELDRYLYFFSQGISYMKDEKFDKKLSVPTVKPELIVEPL